MPSDSNFIFAIFALRGSSKVAIVISLSATFKSPFAFAKVYHYRCFLLYKIQGRTGRPDERGKAAFLVISGFLKARRKFFPATHFFIATSDFSVILLLYGLDYKRFPYPHFYGY